MTDEVTITVDESAGPIREPRGPSFGQIVAGALLILIGIAWLLEAADWADVPWQGLLAGALVIVGVALMFGARTGSHGGLIAFGIVLAVVMALSTAIDVLADIPLSGGVGEETHRPIAAVESEYRWGIGSMTLDLREADLIDGEDLEASVAVGELIVILPADAAVRIDGRAGIGEVVVFGRRSSGLGADLVADDPGATFTLDLDVAIGKVEVRR
jgi:hypothetical protein